MLDNPKALIVGSISSIDDENSLSLIPPKFNQWLDIMTKEAARRLPDHKIYDHAIELKDGQQLP
jgi:DNA-binding transcriptional regulator YdaS (Cro superfamily)